VDSALVFLNAAEAALLGRSSPSATSSRGSSSRLTAVAAISASALLRGTYHLYQGWGGFLGNLAMGALFGYVFVRARRTWPLVIAHFLLDVAAALGYVAFREHLPGFH
jgi:membrane protease YdiL (CAAX protease family)